MYKWNSTSVKKTVTLGNTVFAIDVFIISLFTFYKPQLMDEFKIQGSPKIILKIRRN